MIISQFSLPKWYDPNKKPTRVTRKTATAIDQILTNCFTEAIFKSETDDFSICFLVPSSQNGQTHLKQFVGKSR